MKILVVSSTEAEIAPFLSASTGIATLVAGVGVPATVYHLTKKLLTENFDLAIQCGIAGSFSKKLKAGEVVVAQTDAFADLGAEERKKFSDLFALGLLDINDFPFNDGRLVNTSAILSSLPWKKVEAVTVNLVSDRKRSRQRLRAGGASIESMEGAAFHFVCLQQRLPFIQLRSISNRVGDRDKKNWEIPLAVANLNTALFKLITSLQ